jgi:threonine dehydrogenase-like Zn-dependent dehydrogenase
MKALVAHSSVGKEVWNRFKSGFFSKSGPSPHVSLHLSDIPEPAIPHPEWVKIRTITSGISDIDEGMFLYGDFASLGAYLTFPFVPGNENLGIITEVGSEVSGVEPGDRVVVDPLLSCRPRGIQPVCTSCAEGDPSSCRNFFRGRIGPGVIIGACTDTGGGWADSFLAHASQIRPIPSNMETENAILLPEFARAVRAVLQHPPAPGDRVIILGARSLGLLTLIALHELGFGADPIVVAEQPFEVELARKFGAAAVVLLHPRASAYEDVAKLVAGTVRYPQVGRIGLEGGADLVYETTGIGENIGDALCFTGESKALVLMAVTQASAFNIAPIWFKGIQLYRSAFSGFDRYRGEVRDTFDIAFDLVASRGLPSSELITHRLKPDQHGLALGALQDRSGSKAVKVIFQHVM